MRHGSAVLVRLAVVLSLGWAGTASAQAAGDPAPRPREKPVVNLPLSTAASGCTAQLLEAGAVFRATPSPPAGALGCGIDDPVRLDSVAGTVFRPRAVLSCVTALKLVRFLQRPLTDEVRATMNTDVKTVHVAASYACRGRNRQAGAKLSEHGYGRAVDIRGLTFADGRRWDVSPRRDNDRSPAARLQRRVRALACGPFTTVLGPGSDAYHDDHFHFDLAPRNAAYCR
ncbi:extensin family protein [Stappia stellulata]|uniref:extensin-like domain-containing protein n=1 Tax=Stappia stellulata TaxID=71235 RepID=UPI000687AEB5|nr:extensin family protein [Stappia stellulata]